LPPDVLFSTTISMLEKLLDFQSQRHNILSTNVAHVDTPGYKGHDLRFSDELKNAVGTKGTIPLKRTNERHLPLEANKLKGVKGRLVPCNDAIHRRDGNTVDLDKEMAKLAENSLYYNATAQIISKKMSLIRTSITEVR
jgi:flagellar basal-body rod protein FlgB